MKNNLNELSASELATELSRARRISAMKAHMAACAKDSDPELNRDAVAWERYEAHVRHAYCGEWDLAGKLALLGTFAA